MANHKLQSIETPSFLSFVQQRLGRALCNWYLSHLCIRFSGVLIGWCRGITAVAQCFCPKFKSIRLIAHFAFAILIAHATMAPTRAALNVLQRSTQVHFPLARPSFCTNSCYTALPPRRFLRSQTSPDSAHGPLSGIKVLDMTRVLAGVRTALSSFPCQAYSVSHKSLTCVCISLTVLKFWAI